MTREKTDTAITINELFFTWPNAESPLFENLNLCFQTGHTVCFIGPNGSGKTSLMELILGWRRIDSGYVGVGGRSIASIPSRERGQIMALVPQEERIPFSYSILEYVLLGRAPYLRPLASPDRDDRDYAKKSLEKVGIGYLARRSVLSLSGGERRMVLIARALVQNPRIMLLDEPLSHLDPANRERVIEILINLKASGMTIIMSSHDPGIVLKLTDQVVLLRGSGNPIMGSPDKLLTSKHLSELYGIRARVVNVEGEKLILWGK